MNPDTMRLIDRWVGIPLCFITSFLPLKKNQGKFYSKILATNNLPLDSIVFIGIAEIGALVIAYPAIKETRKQHPKSRICFITAPAGKQTLELMGFEKEDIFGWKPNRLKAF